MLYAQPYKLILIAVFGLSLTHTPQTKSYDSYSSGYRPLNNFERYVGSFVIGLIHGVLNKTSEYIDLKAQKNGVFKKKDPTFETLTFISAHMVRLQLLSNNNIIDIDTKNIVSAWWHGFGQALIESLDIKTDTFTNTPMNSSLGLASLGLCGLVVQNFINQA